GGEEEGGALEQSRIDRAAVGERGSGLAHAANAVQPEGPVCRAGRIVRVDVPASAVLHHRAWMDGARSGFSAALLVVLERDLAPLVRGAAERGEQLVRATRGWGGGGHAAGESGVEVPRLGGQLVGELAQGGND